MNAFQLLAISPPVRAAYVVGAAALAVLVLVSMEVLWRLRSAQGSRGVPAGTHASLLCLLACAVSTGAIYWHLPDSPVEGLPSFMVPLIRLRDVFLGVGAALNVGGLLLMAWPRRRIGRGGSVRVPIREALSRDDDGAVSHAPAAEREQERPRHWHREAKAAT